MFDIIKYDSKIDKLKDLNKLVLICYQTNKDFFNKEIDGFQISFFYARDEMDQFQGYKTADWIVGSAHNNSQIGIFSPKVFNKVSSHPESDFPFVLTHEITHLFTNKLFKFKFPHWLREGIAGYVAKQYTIRPLTKNKVINFELIHTYKSWMKNPNYAQAYSFTKYLVDKFSKDKLLKLLIILEEHESFKEFAQKFENIFKTSLDKSKDSWQKTLT